MDVTINAPILEPVWIGVEAVNRLDKLCDGLGKSRADVVAAALYFFEQSLLHEPSWIIGGDADDSRGRGEAT